MAEMPQDEASRERWCLGSQWGVLTRRCTQGKATGCDVTAKGSSPPGEVWMRH